MQLHQPDPRSAPHQLRALVTIATVARDGLGPPQRALVCAMQNVIFHTKENLDDVRPISPPELAAQVNRGDQALQLIRLLVVVSVADGPPCPDQASLIAAFAAALAVDEPAVKVMTHLANGRLLRFRLAFLRRSLSSHDVRNTYRMSARPG